jgi:two-component system NtrC family sensor kinase
MLRLGLRTKFFLYSNTVIVVTMGLAGLLAVVHERQSSYRAIESRGRSVTEALAIPITDALMYEQLGLVSEGGLIDDYISEMTAHNRDLVRYVIVTDPNNIVTYTNRWELLGKPFTRGLGAGAKSEGTQVEMLTSERGERVLEVRTPLRIASRSWGGLAVGFSLAPVVSEVQSVAKRAALIALLLMLGNSILTAVYVETLISPILHLHQTMKRAGEGDLDARAHVRRADEVGELAEAFNRMMDEIKENKERDARRQAQLAHTEKMVAVGTLAAGVAHEVNNPLAGILTCIETIRANPEDAEQRTRYLGLIQSGIERIEHTVLNLLDFSRPRESLFAPTSLNHNLQHVAELVEFQARKNGVEVVFDLDPSGAVVQADHFQIEQLLLNLVLNAIQAMPKGGTLTLRTRAESDKTVAEIADTGVGIPPEIRHRIFNPFFTTRGVGQGTGLGLSVSYGIAQAHGGVILVESEVGQGSRFTVVLPARQDSEEAEVSS